MGPGTDSHIGLPPPVDEIVTGHGRRSAGVVRDLVGRISVYGQYMLGHVVKVRAAGIIGGDQGAPAHRPVEGGARLDGQLIGGDVVGIEGERLLQGCRPRARRLVRQGIDQVEGQLREQAPRQPGGAGRLLRPVIAAQQLQGPVLQALHPERQAGDSSVGEGGEVLRLRIRGIGLETDLDRLRRRPETAAKGDQPGHVRRVHQGRRAPAEEDRHQGVVAGECPVGDEVGGDGVHQGRLFGLPSPVAIDVEVAIGTDPRAVGPVDIDPQGGRGCAHQRARFSFSKAMARWLMASFSAASISAKVRVSPRGTKIGS